MRAFACPVCHRLAPFESDHCAHCGAQHGFDWHARELRAQRSDRPWVRCADERAAGCNGLADAEGSLCLACALTRTRPADGDEAALEAFATAEAAKRRLVFELGELGLPLGPGLSFDLLSSNRAPVTTGHADGVVTIDLAEADDAHRESVRAQMAEPYRTLLGHLRHEVGHFYEPILVGDDDIETCRALFGDNRADYQEALDRHYSNGPPDGWEERFVSSYATMHPWEDWAETFAHYLHIVDTLQTAGAYGVRVEGPAEVAISDPAPLHSEPEPAPEDEHDFEDLIDAWLPLTYALNALNRSMGDGDLYPFVLSPPVMEKLGFVHRMVRKAGVQSRGA